MTATLPPAAWSARPNLAVLTRALGPEAIRWVGGAVRDTILGAPVDDIDCATTHHPAQVIDRCKAAGIRVVPTGLDHGTVTAVFADGPVEITTLRRDVATDGRRATIAFATDWREDAARRDFTINALYAHPESGAITDYFGGLEDLAQGRVRFIGNASERIAEDHLRILRYYRFQARFGAQLDDEAEAACAAMASTLQGLSRERIASELLKLLALPDPHETVARMRKSGVLGVILPEAGASHVDRLKTLIDAELEQGFAPVSLRRLAALLPPMREIAETVAARLRLSKAQRARLVCASERSLKDARTPKALAYRVGVQNAQDRLLLLDQDAAQLNGFVPPTFPLKGGEIVARGIATGPAVARTLQAVERQWIAEGFPDITRIEQIITEQLRSQTG